MKCQRCPKQATVAITEVLGDERFEELNFCEDCAKRYLADGDAPAAPPPKAAHATAAGAAKAAAALVADPAEKQCEACGVKFVEFRNTGRLGCPHDYDQFREELLPLLDSIHGDVRHAGKSPRKKPLAQSTQLELAGLRKRLQRAIDDEAYEAAAKLRDQIRRLESP